VLRQAVVELVDARRQGGQARGLGRRVLELTSLLGKALLQSRQAFLKAPDGLCILAVLLVEPLQPPVDLLWLHPATSTGRGGIIAYGF
jgi:hypothetical protein